MQDFNEYYPDEGIVARHHLQPRKALYRPSGEESRALDLGVFRCTDSRPVSGGEYNESWDDSDQGRKLLDLWTGTTYLASKEHTLASAMAAVKKIKNRNKNDAKKQARAQSFYDVNQLSDNKGCMYKPAKQVVYDMSSFLKQAVEKYKSLVGPEFRDLKNVSTQFAEDRIARPAEAESGSTGKLAPIASRVLMKLLFAARMARYDLLRAVQGLASRVTKWSTDCDKALHRLMCYVNSTIHYKMSGFIGDEIKSCKLWLFADSDHAGEHDNKSTSGSFLCLVGPNTYFPLAAFSKKQTSIALSSTEAEVVCANVALRSLGLPSSAIWSVLQNAGGVDKNANKPTALGRDAKKFNCSKHPDSSLSKVEYEGRNLLPDGRIVEIYTSSKPNTPVELTTHPLRDVWLLQKGNWTQVQEAVAWEELTSRTYQPPTGVDAVMLVYRRSGADYRRHAEAEAMLHLETLGIRDSGGYQFERRDPVASIKDYGLIMAAPHSVQPVVLEDNQATIRILESGKSPAFRHADKTQRINLGWISEQFRRKHYALAYVSTTLQAADILTKPFTSADKWNKALDLLSIRRAKQPTRKASAAPTAGACRTTRPEAQFSRLMIEVCCGSTSILGEVAKEKYPECEVLRITKNEDLNNVDTRKSILSKAKSHAAVSKPILVWASLPCTGGSTWSHLNLTIEGNRERVLAARKLFTKLWASFVDLSCGLDRIGVQYAIEWPKNCVYWSWDRIRKWLKSHELPEVTFDGCRLGLKESHGTPVKKPWRIATSCKAIVKAFKNKTCRGGHSHAKCLKDSEDYTPKFASLVHQAFALQAAERRQNRCAVAALPAQPATPAIPYAPVFAENMASSSSAAAFLADAASPNQETMQANIRRFLQRLDENRPAGARANKQTPTWLIEALTKIEEPPADADDQDRFLGIIPVFQWRELREEFPSMAWIMLVEVWYRQYGVSMAIPNRTITDTTLAGWSCRMKEFIEDVSVLAWGPRKQDSLLATQKYDICHRLELIYKGTGSFPIFAASIELLAELYTPAFERIPPPEAEQESFVIVGDSALALCTPGNQRGTIRAKYTCLDRLREECARSRSYIGSTVMDMHWGKDLQTLINGIYRARIQLPDEGESGYHLILVWSGNDVYGTYGYLGFTWHHVHPWVVQTEEMIKKAEHWPAKQKARVLQSVEEVIRLRKEPFVKSVTVVMTNQNAGYGLPEAMDREMTFIANRLRDYGVRVIDSFPLHSETPKVDTYHAEYTPDNMASFVAFYKAMMAGIATDEIIQAGKNQFLLHQRSVVFSNAFRLAREVSAAQARTMSLDDMEPPPADAECPPAERVPEEEIVFEGPIMHEIPEIRQFVEEGGEELTAQDLACLNPSPGGDDVIHPEYDLSIPEVARVAEIVEAANSVIDDDAAKVIEAEDDEIEQILFLQPNMVLEDHTLHNQGTTPKALPKSTPPTESRFFSGTAMDSASSALPDSSPSAVSSAAGTSRGDRDLKPVAKKAGAKKPRQVTEQWILRNQLEDLPDDHFWMTTPARECLGKKMTFIMRGWSNNKKGTPKVHFDRQGSVVWSEFLDALSQIWNGLRMSQVFECLLYGDKARYELLIRSDPSLEELEVLKIRSVQGHGGDLLSDEMDLSEIHKNIFALSDNWRPTLGQRPPVGTQGFLHPNFDTMPMMGYHATKLRNFESVVEYGLFPGGLSADGSPGRVFVMMSAEPEWIRTDNSGARKTAEIEFVIDLQLHALEGGRVMETKIGVLQTADWVSNRHLIYAYHRGSGEPFWFNRAYEPLRKRVKQAVDAFKKHGHILPIFNQRDEEAIRTSPHGNLIDGWLYSDNNERFLEWSRTAAQHVVKNRTPYLVASTAFKVEIPTQDARGNVRRELHRPELPLDSYLIEDSRYAIYKETNMANKDVYVANWGVGLFAWPARLRQGLKPHQRTEQKLWSINELALVPKPACPECRKINVDGMINCVHCGHRLEPQGDLANALSTFKEKAAAAREGRPIDFVKMSPNYDINTNRLRSHQREGDFRDVNSAGSTLRQRCHQVKKKSINNNDTTISDVMHKRPFEAYNYAAKGLSITSLAQIERLAAVRLPDTGMIKDDRDTHHPDGRIAMAWKNGDREISLNEGCLISFQDKFFTIDEMAVILRAVNKTRPRYPFTILGYDRKRYVFDDREVSLLLAKLADFFTSQLPLSVPEKEKDDRLQLPTIVLTKPLDDIPEGLAGLGERQLFAMIENTRFGTYRRDPTNVERRLRRSEGQTRASAPPAGRRGRSPTALIETDQPGVLLARPPPPPPVRHVTEYISAEEWDAIRAGTYGNFAPRERTRSRTRDDAAAPAAPEGGIPAPATPPGGDDYHGQQFIGLQSVPRSAGDVSIGRILQVRDRLLQILDDHIQNHDPDFRYSFPYDSSGNLYAPGRPRPNGYSRAEGYIWAVMSARDNFRVPIDRVVTCVPDAEDASRFWPVPTVEQVHWYLRGWSQHYIIDGQRRQAY